MDTKRDDETLSDGTPMPRTDTETGPMMTQAEHDEMEPTLQPSGAYGKPAHPPGYNPAHVDALRHPADVVTSAARPMVSATAIAAANLAAEGIDIEVTESTGGDASDDGNTVDMTTEQRAQRDLARTQARAHQAAADVIAAIGRLLIGPDADHVESYKRRVLIESLSGVFLRGAAWGTRLAGETFQDIRSTISGVRRG